jgi:hypothetical protein
MKKEQYKMALNTLFMMSSEHLGFELNYEKNLMQELIDAKLEQESRKDKLIVGSKWRCIITHTVFREENITDSMSVTYNRMGDIVTITNVGDYNITYKFKRYIICLDFIGHFLTCFKPLESEETK